MSVPGLDTITITDFRSIDGSVPIPLSAPVVLLHGTNGAGKSTVMSAIELALSGAISGIGRGEEIHLVHRGAAKATIDLATTDKGNAGIAIDAAGIDGTPLLGNEDARFLRERCYLQQRTLGRLLEVYEEAPRDGDSMLTEFVNELLGIDELQVLIDGLEPVRDKRLVKRLVPAYRDLEERIEQREGRTSALAAELQEVVRQAAADRDALAGVMVDLQAPTAVIEDLDAILAWLEQKGSIEEEELVELLAVRREVSALARRAGELAGRARAGEVGALEQVAADAGAAADAWRVGDGAALEGLLDSLRKTLPGVPAAAGAADPATVCAAALEAATEESTRLGEALAADQAGREELARGEEALAANKRRLEGIDQRLASPETASATEELAQVLASLTPHVHGEDCPVCGRDYSEIGGEPLSARLATRVSELSARAATLQEAAKARLEALAAERALEQQILDATRKRMEPTARSEAEAVVARLEEDRAGLLALKDRAEDGASLLRAETEAERDLSLAREKDRASLELREEADRLATLIGRPPQDPATALEETIDALSEHLSARISVLEERTTRRARARELRRRVAESDADEKRSTAELSRERAALRWEVEAGAEVERRYKVMRGLRKEAELARERIVRRVFTETLNRAWRDLFIRLAPDEPFVPAFQVPEGSGGVSARLQTVHRDGEPGGSPGAMLSAGNLNTAALTLFLALNLSVPRRLPWLLLDDPVQSMDEVHVAQFAALLRTLSSGQGRRVVLAVHERALFEYLKLELSPTGPNEPLITVELTRGASGSTSAEPHFHQYVEDRALAAV